MIVKVSRNIWKAATLGTVQYSGKKILYRLRDQELHQMGGEETVWFEAEEKDGKLTLKYRVKAP